MQRYGYFYSSFYDYGTQRLPMSTRLYPPARGLPKRILILLRLHAIPMNWNYWTTLAAYCPTQPPIPYDKGSKLWFIHVSLSGLKWIKPEKRLPFTIRTHRIATAMSLLRLFMTCMRGLQQTDQYCHTAVHLDLCSDESDCLRLSRKYVSILIKAPNRCWFIIDAIYALISWHNM